MFSPKTRAFVLGYFALLTKITEGVFREPSMAQSYRFSPCSCPRERPELLPDFRGSVSEWHQRHKWENKQLGEMMYSRDRSEARRFLWCVGSCQGFRADVQPPLSGSPAGARGRPLSSLPLRGDSLREHQELVSHKRHTFRIPASPKTGLRLTLGALNWAFYRRQS